MRSAKQRPGQRMDARQTAPDLERGGDAAEAGRAKLTNLSAVVSGLSDSPPEALRYKNAPVRGGRGVS